MSGTCLETSRSSNLKLRIPSHEETMHGGCSRRFENIYPFKTARGQGSTRFHALMTPTSARPMTLEGPMAVRTAEARGSASAQWEGAKKKNRSLEERKRLAKRRERRGGAAECASPCRAFCAHARTDHRSHSRRRKGACGTRAGGWGAWGGVQESRGGVWRRFSQGVRRAPRR